MDKEAQKELQQKYMQLQMLDNQISQLQKHHKLLDDQVASIIETKQGLDDLAGTKPGSEILAPISPGIFIKAGLKDISEVVVNVGSDVAVKKSIPSAKGMLDGQLDDIKEAQTRIMLELTQLTNQAMILDKDINNIAVK